MKILIVGLSTRAIAESAVRGGYQVVTLDYFGDRDQKELVENYSLMRDFCLGFSSRALVEAGRTLDFDAVAYISNLENHPQAVERLSGGRVLLGNTPRTLRQVRHWPTLFSFCDDQGIPFPPTYFAGEEARADKGRRWLRKPVRSGGGHGIAFWSGKPLDAGHFLQAYVEGWPCSATFVANGQKSVLIGLTEQLIGREELGARGFTWCGNLLPLALPQAGLEWVVDAIQEVVDRLTRRFNLMGVNGLDFVIEGGEDDRLRLFLLEVNPRYTASMELVEWAYGVNVFDLHVRSFKGELPSFSLREALQRPGFYGKGIVYARRNVAMPDTAGWRAEGRRDIPFQGERIQAGHPICTVLVQGGSREECWRRLLAEADAVRRELVPMPR